MTALRRPTAMFLAASALSSFGNGLTFPVGALYLVRVRGLPVRAAAVFFGASAVAGALASLAFGRAMDRRGPRGFVAAGMLGEAIGLALFAYAGSLGAAAAAGAAIGLGNGLFFTGLTSVLAGLASGPALERVFSLRSWLVNLANSAGALGGGGVVYVLGEAALAPAYLVNAVTSVVLAGVLLRITGGAGSGAADASPVSGAPAWTRVQLAIVLAHALLLLFGIVAFEAVVPFVFVGDRADMMPLAHTVVGASTVAIAIAQLPAGRWSERRRKPQVLVVNAALWGLAAVLGVLAAHTGGARLWALGVAYGVVFGLGECLFSAALQPLVVAVVPRGELARFSGVLSASFSVALAVGPMLGFALVEQVSPAAFWAVVIAAMAASAALWSYVGREASR